MFDTITLFLISQLVVLVVGIAVLPALGVWRLPGPLFASSAWLVGCVVMAAEQLLIAQAHLPWNVISLGLPIIVVAMIGAYRLRSDARKAGDRATELSVPGSFLQNKGRRFDTAVFLVVTVWCTLLLIRTAQERLQGYDAMSNWIFKARIFYHEGTVPASFLTDPVFTTWDHSDYPPLVPLSVAHVYSFTGDNDAIAKGWWVLLAGAAAVALYWGLEGFVDRAARVAGLILLLLLPEILNYAEGPHAGYADLPRAVLLMYSGIFFFRWLWQAARVDFVLAVFFLCASGFTKNEGLIVAAAGLVLIWLTGLVLRRDMLEGGRVSAVLVLLILLPWQVEVRLLGLQSDLHPSLPLVLTNFPGRIGPILERLFVRMTDINQVGWTWIGLPFVSLAGLVRSPRRWLPALAILALILIHLASIILAHIVTPYDLNWHLSTSADRLVFQITPLVLLLITVSLGLLIDNRQPEGLADIVAPRLPDTEGAIVSR